MYSNNHFSKIALLASLLLSPLLWAEEEADARSIMEKNFNVTKIHALQSWGGMKLISDSGQVRERHNNIASKLQPNGIDSKLLVTFQSPTDIKGTVFLQVEHSGGDDDLWIYLPALGKVRRLIANNKRDSFVGSDFSYGDILLPKVDLYDHRILRTEQIDGQTCTAIESKPKTDATKQQSGYSRKLTWVRMDNFLETRVEYFDLHDAPLKSQTVTLPKKVEASPERWIALRREMINQQTGHKTIITIDRIDAETPVPDGLFSSRSLERP